MEMPSKDIIVDLFAFPKESFLVVNKSLWFDHFRG